MRIVTRDGIERVLRANPIAEVAAEHGIHLRALGEGLLVGRCPRHPDSAGLSLLIEPGSGRFRCLVCWFHGGNVIGLVMQLDGLPFMPAVLKLAARAGFDVETFMSERERPRLVPRSEVPAWALTPPRELALLSSDRR